jgi:hypothetical protein
MADGANTGGRSTALDRDALYYPYIHIHDVNWLKSTLLCFPSVRRILPDGYMPAGFSADDSAEIQQFCRTVGVRGPLLQPCRSIYDYATAEAANELQRKIQAKEDFFVERYSRAATQRDFPPEANKFKLHDSKVSYLLIRYLEQKEMAWRGPSSQWIVMHPKLGAAIMSTIALAIAKNEGLDIVTPSEKAHYVTSFSNEEQVFENLLRDGVVGTAPPRADLVDDLAEIVLTTLFDVNRLTVDQIAELQKDGKDLRRFKDVIAPVAAQIPDIGSSDERWRRLREAANQVIEQWTEYKKSLPRFALDALVDATNNKTSGVDTGVAGWSLRPPRVEFGLWRRCRRVSIRRNQSPARL